MPAISARNVVKLKQLQRASRRLHVIPEDADKGIYTVQSATNPQRFYQVTIDPATLTGQCTCAWARNGGINCKHVLAVLQTHYAGQGSLSFWKDRRDARRQHRRTLGGKRLFATVRPDRRD
jgi:SWIM zinc finger